MRRSLQVRDWAVNSWLVGLPGAPKQLGKVQRQLNGVRAAAKALGDSTKQEVTSAKKRVLSAAGRAKIAQAAKKRWAKVRAQAKKVAR